MGLATAFGVLALLSAAGLASAQDDVLVARGEYLARAGDCVACHTAPGGKAFAGGLYMSTPLGDISTPNITPDRTTGIGAWSDDDFYRAMHEGIGHEGEYLYPAFPFPWYTKVARDDVLAIKAYLFSLPPENAPRKALKLMFPANIRGSLLAWRVAFFKPGEFTPDPQKSAALNHGAYLVEGLGHCGECHNRHNVFGTSDWSGRLEGGEIEGWYAPRITADGRNGVSSWSLGELATFLRTGGAPGKGVALGPMRETIDDSLSHLTDEDIHAMALYLKSTDDEKQPEPPPPAGAVIAGAQGYLSACGYCHRPDGKGVPGMIPALAGNGAVMARGPENVIRVVVGGLPASNGLAPMPAVGTGIPDAEIADIVNYVRTAWGNDAPATAEAGTVAELREKTQTLLAANPPDGCPAVADPQLAGLVKEPGIQDALRGITPTNVLERIDALLPQVRAGGAPGEVIVNGLTAAYCPVVMADASTTPIQRAALLGNFSGLVYGRIANAAKAD